MWGNFATKSIITKLLTKFVVLFNILKHFQPTMTKFYAIASVNFHCYQ